MSLLFHQKSKKIIKFVFIILGILIIISMILLYAPGLIGLGGGHY